MNFKLKILFVLFLFLFVAVEARSQSTYRAGLLPKLNIGKKFTNLYALNFKTESRLAFSQGRFQDNPPFKADYLLTDVSLILSRKVGLNNKIAGGYLARFRDGKVIHRSIQQFTLVSRFSTFRLGHRFASDQSFTSGEKPEIRLRYRIASDFPLNGESLDPKEFYLKVSNEYLNSFSGSSYDLEIRFSPLVGYYFSDVNKFEFGLDYRISSFIEDPARHSFWLGINWYLKI